MRNPLNHADRVTCAIVLLLTAPAFACGVCIREIRGPEKSDALDWDSSNLIFVARILASSNMPERSDDTIGRVQYTYEIEELLKGQVIIRPVLVSHRPLQRPDREEEISPCGHLTVVPDDRVLVFIREDAEVIFRHCGASRVLRAEDAGSAQTLERLRAWRE